MKTTAYMALMGLAQGRNEAAHALVSAATNLEDAFGCPGSNWGNTAEEHAESNCIFNKLSNGHDEIGYKTVHHALEHDCEVMELASATECPALATKYASMLIEDFGSNGTVDRHQFFKAFVVVKGETTGHNEEIAMIDEAFDHINMLTAIDEAFEHVNMLTAID